jgi:hypothetical protein
MNSLWRTMAMIVCRIAHGPHSTRRPNSTGKRFAKGEDIREQEEKMDLDRNINFDGTGKYALVKMRKLAECRNGPHALAIEDAVKTLVDHGILDYGFLNSESEFFVIRLKDKYAQWPLNEYANAAEHDGQWEYGAKVRELAMRAGPASKWCKQPD